MPPDSASMAGPLIYEEDEDDEFVPDQDFQIVIDSVNEPGGGMAFGANAQDATLVAFIPWHKRRSAVRKILGYSYADSGSPYRLYREPPLAHPWWPAARAYGLTISGFGIESNGENDNGEPWDWTPWLGAHGEPLRAARYRYALATVKYKTFGLMRFLPDADIDDYHDEYKRFFTMDAAASVETLSADGASNLKFAEGTPNNTAFPAPLAQLLAKTNLTLTWYSVPNEYVSSDPLVFMPTKIIERLGTWNNDTFLGYRKGELLLLAIEGEPISYPVLTAEPITDLPLVGWNIKLHYSYVSYPKGVEDSPVGTSPYFGHRIFPYRLDGKFYWAKREDGSSELLPGAAHWKVFQHVADGS